MIGSLSNLCALALGLALHIFAITVLISPKKDETAVHRCDPALSVLAMFGVSKRIPDPTLATFIVCGKLQFLLSHKNYNF